MELSNALLAATERLRHVATGCIGADARLREALISPVVPLDRDRMTLLSPHHPGRSLTGRNVPCPAVVRAAQVLLSSGLLTYGGGGKSSVLCCGGARAAPTYREALLCTEMIADTGCLASTSSS
jgi:hypothetical protein